MTIFKRRAGGNVPIIGNYHNYKSYVREDFCECCAYCLVHELLAGGEESFELDHFKPQSKFPDLTNDFYNIYYSCHSCNKYKCNSWPDETLIKSGYNFVDYCNDTFSSHFKEQNGKWIPISHAGEYTNDKLRLNRKHFVEIRTLLYKILELSGEKPFDWDKPMKYQIEKFTSIISKLRKSFKGE